MKYKKNQCEDYDGADDINDDNNNLKKKREIVYFDEPFIIYS